MSNRIQDTLGELLRAVQRAPDSIPVLQNLAIAFQQMQRWAEACEVNEKITRLNSGDWQAWARLGLCHSRLGNIERSTEAYRAALAIELRAELHNDLGVVLMNSGDGEAAVAEFEKANNIDPGNTNTLNNLGISLRLVGRLIDARGVLDSALALNPGDADCHANLGNTLRDLGEKKAAIESLKESIRLRPNAADVYGFLAGACLEAGQPRDALQAIDGALRLDPVNRTAMAYKAAALQEVEDYEGARFQLDHDHLIEVQQFDDVPGAESVQALNEQLSAHVLAHPSLAYERTGNATRFGSHTSNLLHDGKGPAAHLEAMINSCVKKYYAKRKLQAEHPFMAHRMPAWKVVAWAVVMRSQGHQIPHIHPSAWLSGVYYAKLPDVVKQDSSSKEGWLEFGSPPENLACKNQKLQKFFLPQEGMMVLFPSYFYHQTIPFNSQQQRISIAFDVTPA